MLDDTFDKFEIGSWSADGMVIRAVTKIKNIGKTGVAIAALCASGVVGATSAHFDRTALVDQSNEYAMEVAIDERPLQRFDAKNLTLPLKALREMKLEPYLAGSLSANRESIRIARIIAHQIDSKVAPSIGLDEDGSIFLHFSAEKKHAYLTIEADAYHLLCIVPGELNTYIDDERLTGKKLPASIKNKIASIFS